MRQIGSSLSAMPALPITDELTVALVTAGSEKAVVCVAQQVYGW